MPVSSNRTRNFEILIAIYTLACFATLFLNNALILILFEFILTMYFVFRCNKNTLIYFIFATVLQNFTLVVLSRNMSGTETSLAIFIKELAVYLCAMLFIVQQINNSKFKNIQDIIFVFFMSYAFLISFSIAAVPMSVRITSLRQFVIPFFCFYFGCSIKLKNKEDCKIDKILVFVSVIVCILGLVIYVVGNENFWINIGYRDYIYNKLGSLKNYSIANFYTWDFGIKLKRFVSIFADPLACSHFLAMAFILLFYKYPHKYLLVKMLIALCMILCLSKAHLVIIFTTVFLHFYTRTKQQSIKIFYKVFLVIGFFSAFIGLTLYTNNLKENTAIGNHFSSFLAGLRDITLLGHGLGSSGYNAKLAGLTSDASGTSESLAATLMFQMGIIGVIAFYAFIAVIISMCAKKYLKTKNKSIYACLVLMFSFCIESLVSASSLSMLGTGLYFVFTGLYIGTGKCANSESIFELSSTQGV